jgi:ATP-binding cassette subfamily B (MDR/TAP) protein 1
LILDEATSSIDVRGEQLVQAALDRVSKGRTTIVIAHRLSTIRKAHQILVMRKGRIVEQGTHDQLLLKEDGAYRNLVNVQQMTMGKPSMDEHSNLAGDSSFDPLSLSSSTLVEEPVANIKEAEYEKKGVFGSLGLLFFEEKKSQYAWYFLMITGTLLAGGKSIICHGVT